LRYVSTRSAKITAEIGCLVFAQANHRGNRCVTRSSHAEAMRKRGLGRVTALVVGLGAAGVAIGWMSEEMALRQAVRQPVDGW
jgi:cysteine synthase